jgi:hypothetical protein
MVGIVEADLEQFSQDNIQAFEALFREYQAEAYGWIILLCCGSATTFPSRWSASLVFWPGIVPGLWGLWNMLHIVVRKGKEDSN